MATREEIIRRRDAKVIPHLEQYAPVWIVPNSERFIEEDESIQFNVIFQHNRYGWVTRRYRYDGFNDVLYHKGQVIMDEEKVLELQETEPYIAPSVADIPNHYGG